MLRIEGAKEKGKEKNKRRGGWKITKIGIKRYEAKEREREERHREAVE